MVKEIPQYKEMTIFSYAISHLKNSDKVRFYYALKGRDGRSGIIKTLNIFQFGKTVLMVSREHEKEMDEFLGLWKCTYQKKQVLIEK